MESAAVEDPPIDTVFWDKASWQSPSGATEDHNEAAIDAATKAAQAGGRPSGRPRIATTPAARMPRRGVRVAVVLRGDRGSQRRERLRVVADRDCWRSPSGATEDRNGVYKLAVSDKSRLAVALQGDQRSQRTTPHT